MDICSEIIGIVFKPIGINEKPLIISLLTGLVAKENILSTISLFDGYSGLPLMSTISFLLFIMLYSPCIPALKCAKVELGKRFAFKLFFVQTLLAYSVSFVLYTFGSAFGLMVGFVVTFIFIVLTLECNKMFHSKCIKNCKSCTQKA